MGCLVALVFGILVLAALPATVLGGAALLALVYFTGPAVIPMMVVFGLIGNALRGTWGGVIGAASVPVSYAFMALVGFMMIRGGLGI
jgi:hypothetical protein